MKNGGLRPEIANSNCNDERLSAFGAKAVPDICCSRRRSQRSSLKTVSLFSFCMQKPLFTLRVRAESPAHTGVTYSALTVVLNLCSDKASALSSLSRRHFVCLPSSGSRTGVLANRQSLVLPRRGGILMYHRSKFGRVSVYTRASIPRIYARKQKRQ